MGGDLSPQPDHSILEIFVIPESGVIGEIIAVPVAILSSRQAMQVQDGVDAVLGTLSLHRQHDSCSPSSPQPQRKLITHTLHHPIHPPPTTPPQLPGPHILFKNLIPNRHPQTIQAQSFLEPDRILVRPEILVELFEEEVVVFLAESFEQGVAVLGLGAGVAGYEILHVEVAAESGAAEEDWGRGGGDNDGGAGDAEDGRWRGGRCGGWQGVHDG